MAIIGVDGDPTYFNGMLVSEAGRWLRGGNEIVVGRTLVRDKGLQVGDSLRLNGTTFSIVGVGQLRGEVGGQVHGREGIGRSSPVREPIRHQGIELRFDGLAIGSRPGSDCFA